MTAPLPRSAPNAPPLGLEIRVALADVVGADACNARAEPPTEAETETLARDMFAHGQLQPIVLRGRRGAGYTIADGVRRWLALRWIAANLAPVGEVRAYLFSGDDDDARALSLAANFHRVALHPLEEAERFAALAATIGVERVARDFGLTAAYVRQRIALGRLPEIAKTLWRKGDLTLAAAQALTAGDATDAAALIEKRPELLGDPALIRRLLRPVGLPLTCAAIKFVGEDAYVRAGGEIQRDLFLPDEGVLLDAALLRRLERAKLARLGQDVAEDEGWGHVFFEDGPHASFTDVDLLDAEKAELNTLNARLDGDAPMDDAEAIAAEARVAELLRLGMLRAIPEARRAEFGVMVSIDSEGRPVVERGLIVKAAIGNRQSAIDPAPRPEAPRSGLEGRAADDQFQSSAGRPLPPGDAPSRVAAVPARDGGEPSAGRPLPPGDAPSSAPTQAEDGGESLDDADFAAEAAKAAGRPSFDQLRMRADCRLPTADLPPAARAIALTAATRAAATAVAASSLAAMALFIVAATRQSAASPVGLARTQGPWGAANATAKALAKLDFVAGLRQLSDDADEIALRALFAELVAASLDLRAAQDAEVRALIREIERFDLTRRQSIAAMTANAFDYPAFFRAAPRAVALAAIRDAAGEAHERDHSFKTDSALAEEAARVCRAARWLPEFLRREK